MDLNQPLDYSKLSAVELKALSIACQNMRKSKDEAFESSFPYLTEAILALAEQFMTYPAEYLGGLKIMHDELLTINRHLLQIAPKPPSVVPEETVAMLSNDEMLDGLLKNCLVVSLVDAFAYLQNVVNMRISMIEHGAVEGANNGTIN
jgi:hypothetical protein